MSSTRRTANEINILAMLDRHEAAGLPKRILRRLRSVPAAAWYGTAGVLVFGLAGMLAWLARDGDSSASVDTALAGAVTVQPAEPIAAPPEPASASLSVRDAPAEPITDAAPATGATVVDVAPAPAAEAVAPEHPLPPQEHAGRIGPHKSAHESAREPQRLAGPAPTGKSTPRAAGKSPAAGAQQALAHAEPRHKRLGSQPKTAPEPVDTDVALISAIIQHANKRQEAEEAARKP